MNVTGLTARDQALLEFIIVNRIVGRSAPNFEFASQNFVYQGSGLRNRDRNNFNRECVFILFSYYFFENAVETHITH